MKVDDRKIVVDSCSAADTKRIGAALSAVLKAGDIVLLHGDLGAGKTTLVQGFAKEIGTLEPVTSPTFTLIHEHHAGDLLVVHVDPYRLRGADEVENLGFLDYLSSGAIVFVEWAERLGELAPAEAMEIRLEESGAEGRRITILWGDTRMADLAQALEVKR
jgi:tRNA threonylcarbamoyladenosine biosynthesis protein TsaE